MSIILALLEHTNIHSPTPTPFDLELFLNALPDLLTSWRPSGVISWTYFKTIEFSIQGSLTFIYPGWTVTPHDASRLDSTAKLMLKQGKVTKASKHAPRLSGLNVRLKALG